MERYRESASDAAAAAAGEGGEGVASQDEALRRERDYMAAILDTAAALVVVLDTQGRIVRFNRACEKTTGYRFAEVRDRCFWDIFLLPHESVAVREVFARLRAGDFPVEHENCWLTRNGECRRVAWSNTALVGAAGHVTHIIGTGIDVTERRQAEAILERQHRWIDAIFDSILAQVAYLDNDLNFVRVNATYAQGSGYRVEELIGRNHFDLFPNAENEEIFRRVRDTGEPYVARAKPFEFVDQPERGITYWDWWLRPIHTPEGEREGIVLSLVDVTSAECGRREVERLNAELERANGAKDQFLAFLSHELRNPLSAVLAGIDMLRRLVPSGDSRVDRTLAIVERNARLQTRLVNDLLDLSRIARGKLELRRAPVSLEGVITDAILSKDAEAEQAGLSIRADVEPNLWVYGDGDRLGQVILNLLGNAIKFTPAGGRVLVEASALPPQGEATSAEGSPPRRARVVVEDTGVGIPDDLLPHVFEMFRQGDAATERKPGLGLGLALVRSLVEKHEGRVWAESDGPGEGSRFILELPLMPRVE